MPLLWLSLAFLAGIGIAQAVGGPTWAWAVPGVLFAGAGFWERRWLGELEWWQRWRARSFLTAAALLVALCLGGWRMSANQPVWGAQDLAYYHPKNVRLQAVLYQPPQPAGAGVRLYLDAEQIVFLDEKGGSAAEPLAVRGRLVAVLRAGQELHYGDRVELTGFVTQPPEGIQFSYSRYLAGQDVYSYMEFPRLHWLEGGAGSSFWAGLYRLRENGVRTLNMILPQPESSLLAGILLGVEEYIPEDVQAAFQATGTAHIIAISGFNISILIGLFIGLFRRWLPRLWAVLLAVAAISLYTLLVGAQASVVRAAIMGVMGLVGAELGRRQAGANSLAFTAAVMVLFNPLLLWEAGFQLSFTATLGIILLGEPMQTTFSTWLERRLPAERVRKLAGPVGEYFLLTLAAQLATLPVILGNYGQLSLGAMLANPLVLPVQPLVMILGGISLLAGLVWLPLGQLLACLVWPLLAYTIRVVQLLAGIPGGVIPTPEVGFAFTAIFYSLVLGLGMWRRLLGRWFNSAVLMVVLGVIAAFLARTMVTAPDGRLHLLVLDGGQTPVLLIRALGGGTVLVNGGEDAVQLEEALGRWLPLMTNSLDYLVVPAKSSAVIGALPFLINDRYLPRQVLWNSQGRSSYESEDLLRTIQQRADSFVFLQAGQEVDLGAGARLRVEVVSAEGAAFSLNWGDFRALIPGGISPGTLQAQGLERLQAPGVLILSAADLKNSTPEEWSGLAPDLVIWLGEDPLLPEYGGVPWSALSQAKWLHFTTDGQQSWLETGP
jgi:competence protein ComEC